MQQLVMPEHSAELAVDRPLYVDLDGTLIRSDLLIESVLALVRRNPLYLLLLPWWLLTGRAHLKRMIAERIELDPALLPYDSAFLAYLQSQHAQGRRIILATASDELLARKVADHLGLFEGVIGSDGIVNRKGAAKLAAIREHAHGGPFDYAGNEAADLPILREATSTILVDPDRRLAADAETLAETPVVFHGERAGLRSYLRAMRLHQWLKNALIFVPLVLDHQLLDGAGIRASMLAFIAFGLCASSVYLLNDLIDLPADRRHPNKRNRPFAAGLVPLGHGLVLVPILLALAFALSLLLPLPFLAALATYYAATLSYSLFFKRTLLFDVIILAGLYTMRIVAGSFATGIPLSFWLLSFSVFLFLSLSLVKRFTELHALASLGETRIKDRGYRIEDSETLAQFGTASGLMSVLVLALYVNSPEVHALYRFPEMIWLLCPIQLYIVCRFWVLARRNEMNEDPLVFAIGDWRSIAMVGIAGILLLLAR